MRRKTRFNFLSIVFFAAIFSAGVTQARPVTVSSVPVPGGCDNVVPNISHELGDGAGFSLTEVISWSADTTETLPCPKNSGGGIHTLVTITNNTDIQWEDLWFVADNDSPFVLTNPDAFVGEIAPLASTMTFSFRIDNIGDNKPLRAESIAPDLIFDPGESWQFIVQNWGTVTGACAEAPGVIGFASAGVGGVSCPDTASNASIIARPVPAVPAPSTAWAMLLGVIVLCLQLRPAAVDRNRGQTRT